MLTGDDELKRALAHVLWLGGPPDSGKTSIATLLAERHGFQRYQFDRQELAHFARRDPARHPALHAMSPERVTPEERWVVRPPEEMARLTIASWSERVELAIEDLLALPLSPPIVAEGPGFFPERIAPLLTDRRQAIWLVPSEPFKRASAERRGKPGDRDQTSDPERATRNLVARDLLMGEHVRQHAEELGLTVIEVDGRRSLDELTDLVAKHFAPHLRASGDRR